MQWLSVVDERGSSSRSRADRVPDRSRPSTTSAGSFRRGLHRWASWRDSCEPATPGVLARYDWERRRASALCRTSSRATGRRRRVRTDLARSSRRVKCCPSSVRVGPSRTLRRTRGAIPHRRSAYGVAVRVCCPTAVSHWVVVGDALDRHVTRQSAPMELRAPLHDPDQLRPRLDPTLQIASSETVWRGRRPIVDSPGHCRVSRWRSARRSGRPRRAACAREAAPSAPPRRRARARRSP